MKVFILFLLCLGLSAQGAPKASSVSDALKAWVAREVPKNSEILIDSLFLNEEVGAGVALLSLAPRPAIGLVSFELRDTKRQKNVRGTAVVKVWAPVAVTTTNLRHGEKLSESSVRLEKRELSTLLQSGFYDSVAAVVGKQARGFVKNGAVLGASNVEESFLIEQGQTVDLVLRRGSLEVSARARALQSGRQGDWIRVENSASKKILQAKVTGQAEVTLR